MRPTFSHSLANTRKNASARSNLHSNQMMRNHFSETMMYKLIKLVKCRQFIWNNKYETYNDRFLVAIGWKEIEEELKACCGYKVAEETLRQKWRTARDTFKREIKKCPCQTPEDYTGKWQYFKSLFFLQSTHHEDNEKEDNQKDNEETAAESDETRDYIVKIEHNEETIQQLGSEEYPMPEESHLESVDENDYDLMFLKSLLPYFRHLDPIRKLVLRSTLQSILLEELSDQSKS